jgi:hypothetical protein
MGFLPTCWHNWPMTVDGNDEQRVFVARPGAWGAKFTAPDKAKIVNRYVVLGMVALAVVPALLAVPLLVLTRGAHGHAASNAFQILGTIFLFVVVGGILAVVLMMTQSQARSQNRGIVLRVTSRALTVDERPGESYPFLGAKLGTWGQTGSMTMGTALHLQSGTRHFTLGGRDHRLPEGTPLTAPDAGLGMPTDVDAWLPATDFDAILEIYGGPRRTGDAESGGERWCLLFPNMLSYQKKFVASPFELAQLKESCQRPCVGIFVGAEAIWVTDLNTNAPLGSASLAQVTATPATYKPPLFSLYRGRNVQYSIAPEITVSAPSIPSLRIACIDSTLGTYHRRFVWPAQVPEVNDPADYMVSGADWQTLVRAFGLARYLQERV